MLWMIVLIGFVFAIAGAIAKALVHKRNEWADVLMSCGLISILLCLAWVVVSWIWKGIDWIIWGLVVLGIFYVAHKIMVVRRRRSKSFGKPVFVSFCSADKDCVKDLVDRIVRNGFDCWCSLHDVPPGDDYAVLIPKAIKESRLLLLVASKAAYASKDCEKEVKLANDNGKLIVPYRIEDVKPGGAMEYHLASVQHVDGFGDEEQRDAGFRNLLATIERIVCRI